MSIIRVNQLPEGSGNLTNDDIFIFMDDPAGSGITKKISLSEIGAAVGGGGGNPFDQDLNTTNFPTFSGVSLSNGTSVAVGTFDNSTGGYSGISLNCAVGYELNWQGGHLKCTQDGGAASANIILDSALQFSDNVVVCSTADNLALKYAAAKTLTPGGNSLSTTNRATLVIMPGNYSLSEELEIDAQFVDILGLGSMKLDRGCKTAVTLLTNTINVTANDVRVKGISVGSQQFKIANNLPLQVIEDCIGGNSSFGWNSEVSGTFINCVGGNDSFGGPDYENNTGGTASGTFTNCSAGIFSFGSSIASGTFTNCYGGDYSFAGLPDGGGTASGTFINCVGGYDSFGGQIGGVASGNFINCTGESSSFGGAAMSGKFLKCILTSGTFNTTDLTGFGKIRLCIDGNYDVINADAPNILPGPPINLFSSGDWNSALTWDAPTSDGGSPILGYKIYSYPYGSDVTNVSACGEGSIVPPRTWQACYSGAVQVVAYNDNGEGLKSDPIYVEAS